MGITVGSSLLWAVAFIVITKGAESSRRQHTTGGYNERNPLILETNLPYAHRRRSGSKNFGYTKWDSWTPDRSKVTPEYRRRVLRGRNEDHLKSTRHKAPSGNLGRLIADLDSAYEAFGTPARRRQQDFAKDKDIVHQALLNYNNRPHKRRSSFSTGEDRIKWHRDRYGVQDELRSLLQLYKTKYPEFEKHGTDNWYPRDINKWLNPEHDIHKQFSHSSHLRIPNLRTGVFKQTKAKQWEESESTIKRTHHDRASTVYRSPNPDRDEKVIWERINSKPILDQSQRHPSTDNNKNWPLWDGHGKSLQRSLDNDNTGSHKIDSPHIDKEQTFQEYEPVPVREEVSAETADNFSNDENSVQDSNEKGNTDYIITKTQVTDTIDNPVSDDERHAQPTREHKKMPVGEEVTAQTEDNLSDEEKAVQDSNETGKAYYANTTNTRQSEEMINPATHYGRHEQKFSEYKPIRIKEEKTAQTEDDVKNEEKAVQDSNQKAKTDYDTTNTPATGGMNNALHDDRRHDQMITEHKPLPVREELTAQTEDDVDSEEKSVLDSNEKVNTDYATTNTPQSDKMDNPATDDWRHEQTTSEYKLILAGEDIPAETEYDINNEKTAEHDSNYKDNIEYATTNTPQSDGIDNSATDDGRHEQTTSEYKPILAGEDITAPTEDDVNNEEKAKHDSDQKGNTDYATTYTPATDGMHIAETDHGRHDQSIKEYKPLPVVEEFTVQPEDDVNNEQKAVHNSDEKGNIEYATINTPLSDGMHTPPTNDGRHEQTTKEYKPIPVGDNLSVKSVDYVSDEEKAL